MRVAVIRAPHTRAAGPSFTPRRRGATPVLIPLAAALLIAAPAAAAPAGHAGGHTPTRAGAHTAQPPAATTHSGQPGRTGTAPSSAARRPIAILSLQLTGDAAPELKPQLEKSLRAGLASRGAHVIGLSAVMGLIGGKPDLLGCTSTTCLTRIGAMVGARRFVAATVAADGAAYTIDLRLLSADAEGGLARDLKDACTVCTLSDLHARVKATAAALISPARAPVPVLITTQPAGATLSVDGMLEGSAPYKGKLMPGSHRIRASHVGFVTTHKRIEITSTGDSPEKFTVVLAAPSAPQGAAVPSVQGARSGHRRYRLWKWITGGGAIASVATGVALIALDGQRTCSPMRPQTQCPQVYDTETAGLVGAGLGLGLAVVSGWMFYEDRSANRRGATVAVAPTLGGAAATLAVRF